MNEIAQYFESVAGQWDLNSERPGVKHIAIAQLAGVFQGARVLDVGCGTGIMGTALCASGASDIVALDLSQTMIDIAKQKYRGLPVHFEQADVCEFAKREGIELFDVVVIYNAYPHFLDKEALVDAVAHALKPDGRFLVAHGSSKHVINNHHKNVPENITSTLLSADEESKRWKKYFSIDVFVDTDYLYAFGGVLK